MPSLSMKIKIFFNIRFNYKEKIKKINKLNYKWILIIMDIEDIQIHIEYIE